jgi:uroporphyrinogen-III decarboxylase
MELNQRHCERLEIAYQRIEDVYNHRDTGELPFVIQDVNYWVGGEKPAQIPDDYFSGGDFSVMFDYQMKKIISHLERYDDDYIPLLFPWYGTIVVPSALGSEIVFPPKMDPAVRGVIVKTPEDVKKLSMPDPYKDGLMPRVLKCIDYMRANSDLPVSFTDCQGPLNIALSLCGVERLFIWMFEHPTVVHELMDFCTEALIAWVKAQKQHAGQTLDSGAFPHGIVLPKGFGGVWISDDDCVITSPKLYKEFVVPYNSRVFKAFGGGTLHWCGTATHQFENFLSTEGLTGVNTFCMGDFEQVYKMQDVFENRLAIMLCDFTPLHIEQYYQDLFSQLKFKSTILATFPMPEFALSDGKYADISRDNRQIANEAYQVIRGKINQHTRLSLIRP